MTFPRFWAAVGVGLAQVAVWVGRAALWASQHPAVIAAVASLAGHPALGMAVTQLATATAVPPAPPSGS